MQPDMALADPDASASTPLRFPASPLDGLVSDPEERAELGALARAGLDPPEEEDLDGDDAFAQVRAAHGRRR